MEEVSLVADIDSLDANTNVVTLMTLHSAKGLEFPNVYLCGMEDGIFPSYMSITSDDPMDIEEERRLCYVGITRAMKRLHLTCARQRMQNGEIRFNKPSRFVHEIPRYLMTQQATSSIYTSGSMQNAYNDTSQGFKTASSNQNKPFQYTSASGQTSFSNATSGGYAKRTGKDPFANNPMIQKGFRFEKPYQSKPSAAKMPHSFSKPDYEVGDTVSHTKFGSGKVLKIEEGKKDYAVTVEFEEAGKKKMMAAFAQLKKID